MTARPTTDLRAVAIDAFDVVWGAFLERTAGTTTDEYLWEPASGCWTVHVDEGVARVDGFQVRDVEPAPITTIAWRLQHIAVDCLDSYSERAFGRSGASVAGDRWHLVPAAALADCEAAYACFRGGLDTTSIERWWSPLGPAWGPFEHHSLVDLAFHALREVTHHAAEVALLRDLYAARAG